MAKAESLVNDFGNEIRKDYEDGLSLRKLAVKHKTTPATIRKVLGELGVTTRPAGRPKGTKNPIKTGANGVSDFHEPTVDLQAEVEEKLTEEVSDMDRLARLRERVMSGDRI